MSSLMVAVKPEECDKIFNNKQTALLRKFKPKTDEPFKCYIFCIGGKGKETTIEIKDSPYPPITFTRWNGIRCIKRNVTKGWLSDRPDQTWQVLLDYGHTHPILRGDYLLNGKVIGEFICNKVDGYPYDEHIGYPTPAYDGDDSFCDCGPGHWINGEELSKLNMTYEKFEELTGTKDYYGWNISDLKIYDKPKEIYEFYKPNIPKMEDLDEDELCSHCHCTDFGEHAFGQTPGGYYSCERAFCGEIYKNYIDDNYAIFNPPKTFIYVRENKDE